MKIIHTEGKNDVVELKESLEEVLWPLVKERITNIFTEYCLVNWTYNITPFVVGLFFEDTIKGKMKELGREVEENNPNPFEGWE